MYDAGIAQRYIENLIREIESWKVVSSPESVDTIYLGGGTPSLLAPEQLEQLLRAVRERFTVAVDTEVTLEINPGRSNAETLRAFPGLGINRASFGLQTFDDTELARLGRSHNADDARRTFHKLREAGFRNVSFDLIAGLPGQTMAGWNKNLDEAFALRPEHLSFYLLEVHQGTPLADHIKKGIQPTPDEDLAAEMYDVMLDRAVRNGYEHYEISNLCLPGFRSRHNTKYWTCAPYYGFGCSAHSYDGAIRRWANERDVLKYMENIEQRGGAIVQEQQLSEEDRRAEAVFLGLRMMDGLSFSDYQKKFGADVRRTHEKDLLRFREAGLIELGDDLLRLTRTGALLSNEVFAAFV
jgi:oxygen-independent coproporphyrinogen III oxidase